MSLDALFNKGGGNAVYHHPSQPGAAFSNPMVSGSANMIGGSAGMSSGASAGVGLVKMGAQILDGFMAKKQADKEAALQEDLAKQAIKAERSKMRHMVGAARAQMGGSGVAMNTGSALRRQLSNAASAEYNAQMAGSSPLMKAAMAAQGGSEAMMKGVGGAAGTGVSLLAKMMEKRQGY